MLPSATFRGLPVLLAWSIFVAGLHRTNAGGSGLNTIVVVNQNSANSCVVGNYYCERRSVPPQNVLRISWPGGNTSWNSDQYATNLLYPLLDLLTDRHLTNQIQYLVLSMDIPFQTILYATNVNSTTAALFYGLKTNIANNPGVINSYAGSEATFATTKPTSAPGYSFLTTMITGTTLANAQTIIDQGALSDSTFPTQPVLLAKSADTTRSIRQTRFDNAIFNANILEASNLVRTNQNSPLVSTNLFGYQTGLAQFTTVPGTFVPGAIADSFTSFGGIIFGPNDQTSLFAFLQAGAAGSYGTVTEPYTDTQKFPDPMVYFYQARGFNLAESYYQSIAIPYQGLIVAEPLAAPFARPGSGRWDGDLSNAVLSGQSPLGVHFSSRDASHPLQQIDLFVDGTFSQTLTNLPPSPGNLLTVSLNGYPVTYTVPSDATSSDIVTALAAQINAPTSTNATKIKAIARGDRIELQSINTNFASFPFYANASSSVNATGFIYRANYLPVSFPPRLISAGFNQKNLYRINVEIPTLLSYAVEATTNLSDWQTLFTNIPAGWSEFLDPDTASFPQRFYRIAGPVPDRLPKITTLGFNQNGAFQLHMESQPGQPAAILVSSNQQNWSGLITNQAGGTMDVLDSTATAFNSRFYRAWLPAPPLPALSQTNSNPSLVRVDGALQPYTIEYRTNSGTWQMLATNFSFRDVQLGAESAAGSAARLGTFLRASRSHFLSSAAFGMQEFKVLANPLSVGNWLQLSITKTNGQVVVVSVTNQIAGLNATNLAAQLFAAINSQAALLGSDGICAEDLSFNSTFATFFLKARSPGYPASGIHIYPKQSGVFIVPGSSGYLQGNLSDLQPRNHLYVTAGAGELNASFTLDTTQLPDGHHELTAVAYEGSSVRTQTRATIPVCISNSPLSATLTLLDLTNNAPANATYHIQVSANTNNIALTTLFSTGGAIGFATNNSTAMFDVIGTNLWAGLHPFYALVESTTGQKFRTRTSWIRLQ